MPITDLEANGLPVAKLELIAEMLRSGNDIQLIALGASMLPTLWPHDLLTVEAAPDFAVGDIVLYLRGERFCIHRLTGNHGSDWAAQGDALSSADPPLRPDAILGRITSIQRGGHILAVKPRNHFNRLIGDVLCRFDFLRNTALRIHSLRLEFWKQRRMLADPDPLTSFRTT